MFASLGLAVAVSCGIRSGDVVLLPSGFKGWVVIRYDVAGAPALKREGGKTLIQVPPTGSVATQSDRLAGYGIDEYYFVTAEGKHLTIRSELQECPSPEPCAQQFQFFTNPAKATVGKKENLPFYPKPAIGQ